MKCYFSILLIVASLAACSNSEISQFNEPHLSYFLSDLTADGGVFGFGKLLPPNEKTSVSIDNFGSGLQIVWADDGPIKVAKANIARAVFYKNGQLIAKVEFEANGLDLKNFAENSVLIRFYEGPSDNRTEYTSHQYDGEDRFPKGLSFDSVALTTKAEMKEEFRNPENALFEIGFHNGPSLVSHGQLYLSFSQNRPVPLTPNMKLRLVVTREMGEYILSDYQACVNGTVTYQEEFSCDNFLRLQQNSGNQAEWNGRIVTIQN